MKKISYSQDVDALLVELSNEPIAYAEDDGQVILHYSDYEKLVLIEILDFKKFISDDAVLAKVPDSEPERYDHLLTGEPFPAMSTGSRPTQPLEGDRGLELNQDS
ncbi:DUF2283 domain-containing protein [Leptolyngbyaceae cyanobacterium UHCC 1019]